MCGKTQVAEGGGEKKKRSSIFPQVAAGKEEGGRMGKRMDRGKKEKITSTNISPSKVIRRD